METLVYPKYLVNAIMVLYGMILSKHAYVQMDYHLMDTHVINVLEDNYKTMDIVIVLKEASGIITYVRIVIKEKCGMVSVVFLSPVLQLIFGMVINVNVENNQFVLQELSISKINVYQYLHNVLMEHHGMVHHVYQILNNVHKEHT